MGALDEDYLRQIDFHLPVISFHRIHIVTFLVPRIAKSRVAAIFKVNVKTKLIPPLHHHVFEVRDVILDCLVITTSSLDI
jgi:hypothetical protein